MNTEGVRSTSATTRVTGSGPGGRDMKLEQHSTSFACAQRGGRISVTAGDRQRWQCGRRWRGRAEAAARRRRCSISSVSRGTCRVWHTSWTSLRFSLAPRCTMSQEAPTPEDGSDDAVQCTQYQHEDEMELVDEPATELGPRLALEESEGQADTKTFSLPT